MLFHQHSSRYQDASVMNCTPEIRQKMNLILEKQKTYKEIKISIQIKPKNALYCDKNMFNSNRKSS